MGGSFTKQEKESVHYAAFCNSMPSMSGKIVAITGCTSGTGYTAALTVAQKGGEVILLNRASERSEKALKDLQEAVPESKLVAIDCDLMSFESVKAAAAQVNQKCGGKGLDVLCCNAGIMAMPANVTKDGYDVQMQVNHLSHFLLTKELYPLLETAAKKNGEARIVNHSSIAGVMGGPLEARYMSKTEEGGLGGNAGGVLMTGPRWDRYHQTKLANIVFTQALHGKLQAKSSKVKALVAHPGYAMTSLQTTSAAHGGIRGGTFQNVLAKWTAQSQEDGALGILTCIASPEAKSGEFFGPNTSSMRKAFAGKPVSNSVKEDKFQGEASKKLLWDLSNEATVAFGGPFEL